MKRAFLKEPHCRLGRIAHFTCQQYNFVLSEQKRNFFQNFCNSARFDVTSQGLLHIELYSLWHLAEESWLAEEKQLRVKVAGRRHLACLS